MVEQPERAKVPHLEVGSGTLCVELRLREQLRLREHYEQTVTMSKQSVTAEGNEGEGEDTDEDAASVCGYTGTL